MKKLKYSLLFIVSASMILLSCEEKSETKYYSEAELQAALDSILPIKYQQIDSVFEADFKLRKHILLKPYIDSLMARDTTIPTITNPDKNF